MQNILPVLCFIAGFVLAWVVLRAQQKSERRTAAELAGSFAALSADALARNNQAFVQLAAGAVSPVRESLERVDHKIQELEKARAEIGRAHV